ncbi:hypothetical protein [Mesorhizobium sp. NZP2077]|uniref:hypothetical protein n=1 Tax=Mesorhizobium sp. NZP2077 TaxID=2483404 RepID=UPI001556DEF3|nr:hypothetical protein HGP13_31540 [Mesorhizobium sp. NZP2077]
MLFVPVTSQSTLVVTREEVRQSFVCAVGIVLDRFDIKVDKPQGSGSQPRSASTRSASLAISSFLRWSISWAARSPSPSRTASIIRAW